MYCGVLYSSYMRELELKGQAHASAYQEHGLSLLRMCLFALIAHLKAEIFKT